MVTQITPRELADKMAAGESVYLVDVRQPEEHAYAALANSALIPLGELPIRAAEIAPPDGWLVVVYCHHGVRSLTGAALLERTGISPVVSLAGGIDAWSRLIDPTLPRY